MEHLEHLRQLFSIIREQRLFANLKKCDFYVDKIIFLGYVVTKDGIEMDRSKLEAITNWPTPSSIHDVRSFHGIVSFYGRYVRGFSSIMAHVNECLKGLQPIGPMELAPHATIKQFSEDVEFRAKEIKKLDAEVHLKIEKQNAKYVEQANRCCKYVEFEVGDLVWVHLLKDRFPPGKFRKLKPRVDDPFKIIEKIGENAYMLQLLDEYEVSPMFNVKDLRAYHDEDLRASLFSQLWGINVGASINTPNIRSLALNF